LLQKQKSNIFIKISNQKQYAGLKDYLGEGEKGVPSKHYNKKDGSSYKRPYNGNKNYKNYENGNFSRPTFSNSSKFDERQNNKGYSDSNIMNTNPNYTNKRQYNNNRNGRDYYQGYINISKSLAKKII
jgi:hypothetical protein